MAENLHKINLIALTKEHLVDLLTKVGSSSISMSTLEADIASGMPVNSDGTINLIHYAAWLLQKKSTE